MEEMTVHEPTEMERLALEREQTLRQREAALEMRERRAGRDPQPGHGQ